MSRYTSNLIVGCELYKTDAVDKAHDKLIQIWEWLDKLDNSDDTFYLSIREGLKHLTMSTLCHILYTVDRRECRQVIAVNLRFRQKYLYLKMYMCGKITLTIDNFRWSF